MNKIVSPNNPRTHNSLSRKREMKVMRLDLILDVARIAVHSIFINPVKPRLRASIQFYVLQKSFDEFYPDTLSNLDFILVSLSMVCTRTKKRIKMNHEIFQSFL